MMEETKSSASQSQEQAVAVGRFGVEGIGLSTIMVLAIVGIAIADFSKGWGFWYWLAMVPIFAGVSVLLGWSRASRSGGSVPAILGKQVLHWSALPLAVYVIYLLERTGRLNQEDAGLVALLSLALTTLLAGVHFEWRLSVVGILLGVAAFCFALVEEFFWVLVLPALLAGALVVFWRKRAT